MAVRTSASLRASLQQSYSYLLQYVDPDRQSRHMQASSLISKPAVKEIRHAGEDRFSLISFIGFFVFSCHQVAYKFWRDREDRCRMKNWKT